MTVSPQSQLLRNFIHGMTGSLGGPPVGNCVCGCNNVSLSYPKPSADAEPIWKFRTELYYHSIDRKPNLEESLAAVPQARTVCHLAVSLATISLLIIAMNPVLVTDNNCQKPNLPNSLHRTLVYSLRMRGDANDGRA